MVCDAVKLWPFAGSQSPMDCLKSEDIWRLVWTRSEYQGPAEISIFQHSTEKYASGITANRGARSSRA